MALIFLGQTTCALCDQVLMAGENVMGLRAISNTTHPLYKYFDCGFHVQCFENLNKKEEVLEILKEEKRKFKNSEHYKEMVAKYRIPKWMEDDE